MAVGLDPDRRRNRGRVSQNPAAYFAPPRNRPARVNPAVRATTAPPRPASAMLTKYRGFSSPAQVTLPTSIVVT